MVKSIDCASCGTVFVMVHNQEQGPTKERCRSWISKTCSCKDVSFNTTSTYCAHEYSEPRVSETEKPKQFTVRLACAEGQFLVYPLSRPPQSDDN